MSLWNFPGKSTFSSKRLGQKGQGTVEYILVLVVVVAIVLALSRIMYKPMDTFITKMMDEYLQCLLQTGELPVLGGEGGTQTCSPPLYEPISATAGKDKDGDGKADDEGGLGSDKVAGNGSSRGGGGVSTYSRNRGGFKPSGFNSNGGSMGGDGGKGDGKTEVAKAGDSSGYYNFGGNSYGRGGSRTRYIALTGEMAEEVKKKQKEKNRAASQTIPRDMGDGRLAVKKIEVKPPEKKAVVIDDNVKGFDFSKYIKWILIAAIIIVIVVLLGGQALQLSKSWEKGE